MGNSTESAIPPPFVASDMACLKDIADTVRARDIFFVPFFGAFLTFLFAKPDMIIEGGPAVWVEVACTFLLGITYSIIVSAYLEKLEGLRMLFNMTLSPRLNHELNKTPGFHHGLLSDLTTIGQNGKLERRVYKLVMYSLWLSSGTMLMKIFFIKPITLGITALFSLINS